MSHAVETVNDISQRPQQLQLQQPQQEEQHQQETIAHGYKIYFSGLGDIMPFDCVTGHLFSQNYSLMIRWGRKSPLVNVDNATLFKPVIDNLFRRGEKIYNRKIRRFFRIAYLSEAENNYKLIVRDEFRGIPDVVLLLKSFNLKFGLKPKIHRAYQTSENLFNYPVPNLSNGTYICTDNHIHSTSAIAAPMTSCLQHETTAPRPSAAHDNTPGGYNEFRDDVTNFSMGEATINPHINDYNDSESEDESMRDAPNGAVCAISPNIDTTFIQYDNSIKRSRSSSYSSSQTKRYCMDGIFAKWKSMVNKLISYLMSGDDNNDLMEVLQTVLNITRDYNIFPRAITNPITLIDINNAIHKTKTFENIEEITFIISGLQILVRERERSMQTMFGLRLA